MQIDISEKEEIKDKLVTILSDAGIDERKTNLMIENLTDLVLEKYQEGYQHGLSQHNFY